MRQQREFLEHHRRMLTAKLPQFALVHLDDVDAVHPHLAGGGIDQSVDMADEGGLARSGQPHDDLDAAGLHVNVDISKAQDVSVARHQLGLAHPPFDGFEIGARVLAEDLVETPDLDAAALCRALSHERRSGVSAAAGHKPG